MIYTCIFITSTAYKHQNICDIILISFILTCILSKQGCTRRCPLPQSFCLLLMLNSNKQMESVSHSTIQTDVGPLMGHRHTLFGWLVTKPLGDQTVLSPNNSTLVPGPPVSTSISPVFIMFLFASKVSFIWLLIGHCLANTLSEPWSFVWKWFFSLSRFF